MAKLILLDSHLQEIRLIMKICLLNIFILAGTPLESYKGPSGEGRSRLKLSIVVLKEKGKHFLGEWGNFFLFKDFLLLNKKGL